MKSIEFISLRKTSKEGYVRRLERLRNDHGHHTVAGLNRERIHTGILQPYADRPGAALDTLKKLRILIRHTINIGTLKHDPSLGIKRPKIKKIRSWTDDEIEQFKNCWSLGTKQRTAFHLFLNLGQRRSDDANAHHARRKDQDKAAKDGPGVSNPVTSRRNSCARCLRDAAPKS